MSTKVSIADTREWEMFQRIWDTDLVHIRAEMRASDDHNDLLAEEPTREIEIVLPMRWLREFAAGLDRYEAKQKEAQGIADPHSPREG